MTEWVVLEDEYVRDKNLSLNFIPNALTATMSLAKLINRYINYLRRLSGRARASLSRLSLPKTIGGVSISNIRFYNWTPASCLQITSVGPTLSLCEDIGEQNLWHPGSLPDFSGWWDHGWRPSDRSTRNMRKIYPHAFVDTKRKKKKKRKPFFFVGGG